MQSSLFILLLRPSLISGIATILLAVGILIGTNWPYFTYTTELYPILYGDFGVITAFEQTPAFTQGLINSFNESPVLYFAVICVAALVAGVAAFLLIRGIRHSIRSAGAPDSHEHHDAKLHTAARIGIIVTWAAYVLLFFNLLVPFCLQLSRIGAEFLTEPSGILMNLGALVLLIITIHCHVIFLRLVLLRPRVFGGASAIEKATFTHSPFQD